MKADSEAISALIGQYGEALNSSDREAVLSLYADDGVVMLPYNPTAVGKDAVRAAYGALFEAIALTIEFAVAEIVVLSSGWAFARTTSSGIWVDRATGTRHPEGNQELFLFRRDEGDGWKIARYSFSQTLPLAR